MQGGQSCVFLLLGVHKVFVEPVLGVHVHSVASGCLLSLPLLDNRPLIPLRFQSSLLALTHLELLVVRGRARRIYASVHEVAGLTRWQVVRRLHVVSGY